MLGFKFTNANHVLKLLQFMPVDYNLIKRVITSFNNLHFDKETGIMYSLPASRVHELRGRSKLIVIDDLDSIALVTLAASIAEPNSVLDIVLGDYLVVKETRRKGQKTYKHFYEYLIEIVSNGAKLFHLQNKVIINSL